MCPGFSVTVQVVVGSDRLKYLINRSPRKVILRDSSKKLRVLL